MTRQPEGKLVSSARKYLRLRGARAFKIQGGDDLFQEVGIPDILCCYKGRFLGLEAKMPGGKLSAKQLATLKEITDAGGIAAVFTRIEHIVSLLARVDREASLAPNQWRSRLYRYDLGDRYGPRSSRRSQHR